MSLPIFEIEDAALALPQTQRADLAYKLIRSLPLGTGTSADSAQFDSELERRMAAYDAGETTADDWDAVSQRLSQSLQNRPAMQ